MKRAERIAATAFVVAIVAALALFVVYVRGDGPRAEGVLLALALGGVGVGLLVWATRLMPHIHDETHPRQATVPTTEAERESAVETVEAGVEEIKRRRFLSRLLVGAAGALGLAAAAPTSRRDRNRRRLISSTPASTVSTADSRSASVVGTVACLGCVSSWMCGIRRVAHTSRPTPTPPSARASRTPSARGPSPRT